MVPAAACIRAGRGLQGGQLEIQQRGRRGGHSTSTWEPRVLLREHQRGGRGGVRVHVEVGVGVGGHLQHKIIVVIF